MEALQEGSKGRQSTLSVTELGLRTPCPFVERPSLPFCRILPQTAFLVDLGVGHEKLSAGVNALSQMGFFLYRKREISGGVQ